MNSLSTNGAHRTSFRVYFEDTDVGGVVYYANYLRFAERARSELLREIGFENSWLIREHGLVLAVRKCDAEYLRPAALDDELVVETRVHKVGGASMELGQDILRDGELLVKMKTRLGCLDMATGRPKGMLSGLRSALAAGSDPAQHND